MNQRPHFTPALRAGDYIFVSGQMPFDAKGNIVEGGIEAQTQQCLDNIEAALAGENVTLEELVKVMVWLTDVDDFAAFNASYAERFPGQAPARATVCSALMVPGAKIEIEAVAYKPV